MFLLDARSGIPLSLDSHKPVFSPVRLYAVKQIRHARDHRQFSARGHGLYGVLGDVQEYLDKLVFIPDDELKIRQS